MKLLELFSKKTTENHVIPERVVNPIYILNKENREEYIKKGYTIVRKAIDDASIQKVVDTYDEITKLPGYFTSKRLETSPAFGEQAHMMAINTISEISRKIFPNILDEKLCRYDFGGSIIIKNRGCFLEAHQDSSVIDEYKGTTTYAWVPTVNMTADNGTFYAIEGSHLWAAWQRSSQHPSWPLIKHEDFLYKYMKPIIVDKGDILLFDSALIHASGENKTDTIRLAFNMCIIEREAEQVQYVVEKDTPKNMVEKYVVDEAFWHKGDFWGRPKGYTKILEKAIYPGKITEKFLLEQITKFNPANN